MSSRCNSSLVAGFDGLAKTRHLRWVVFAEVFGYPKRQSAVSEGALSQMGQVSGRT
jgi:hypothetical protein